MSFALLTRAKYAIFFQLLGRQLATGLATVLSYEQAQAKADEMRALDMAKSAFFQNSSHELRTPLTLILGPLDDVLREQRQSLPPAIRSTLQICHRNAQRLLGLVNGLLDFSRLVRVRALTVCTLTRAQEAGRTEAVFTPVALGPLVANLCALFRSAIERNGIAYSVQIEETPATPKVYTDVTLFEKVLNNIVGNAAKYTQAGRIDVTLRYSSTEAILSVSDTGCGIAESESASTSRIAQTDRRSRAHLRPLPSRRDDGACDRRDGYRTGVRVRGDPDPRRSDRRQVAGQQGLDVLRPAPARLGPSRPGADPRHARRAARRSRGRPSAVAGRRAGDAERGDACGHDVGLGGRSARA